MADFESNIRIGIDTSQALAAIKDLQRQISQFQTSMARGTAAQAAEAAKLQQELVSSINATGKFSASIKGIQTTTESFTNALEKNKLSFGQYFKYAAGATKTFGNKFQNEMAVIDKTARERVKDLQTQYIKLGRDASGAMKAIAVRPLTLDLEDYGTKTAIAAQKQQILNQLLKQGSTNLLNFGKNTQWAGRQLMVGFTIPLSIFGTTAAKAFMDLEEQVIKFKKVYGDLFTTTSEREAALASIRELANEFTKYGVAVSDTVAIASEAAAAGFAGIDLQRQTQESIRLSVLGQLEQQKALETTISLQNAFRLSSENLAEAINFLNAVENQTVVSLDDITTAIPKVAPVIQSLGGDVKDLAFFLAAMKEGGVNASEGANALKSGLASLINPTDKASSMLSSLGINIRSIVNRNVGDLKGTILDFAEALNELDPLSRARAIEQLFGKFQFARMSTLFDNVIKDGSQASRVLELATNSAAELAGMAEQELGMTAASAMNQFRRSVEDLQAALAPIGELFLKIVTPIVDFATDALKNFNKLDDGVKTFVAGLVGVFGVIGPVALMTFGLLANGVANIIKGFLAVRNAFMKTGKQSDVLGEQMEYMTQQQLKDLAVASSLEQAHMNLAQAFTSEALAIEKLVAAYDRAIQRQNQFRGPGISTSIGANASPVKMQKGGVVTVPGSGKGDKVPALLEPGEAVIPSAMAQKYSGFIQGMIAGTIPGFQNGVFLGMPRSGKSTSKNRDAAEQIYEMFLQSSYANVPPTKYGHQIAPTSGHSFPIFGLGGVYMAPGGKKVFVKPVMDEAAAKAEMRATEIARRVHGLEAPEQRIVVIRDPQDTTGRRRFLALESDLDAKFVNNEPKAIFNEDQYFRQLVASLIRADKDLSAGNVFGNVVADVGPAGVFSRASGIRDYTTDLPSMEEQAMINLLGIKGGAKRAFAESTVHLMAKMTADQYHQYMIAEIQRTIPLLRQTVASFGLSNPAEADAYAAMIKRLEQGLGVNWRRFHEIHSAVKVSTPKQTANPKKVPGYANGIVSVPGPKGAGDIMPAMLSPGEAVIPADKAKKYRGLIGAMVDGSIPGFQNSVPGGIPVPSGSQAASAASRRVVGAHWDITAPKNLGETLQSAAKYLSDGLQELFVVIKKSTGNGYEVAKEFASLQDIAARAVESGSVLFTGGRSYAGAAASGDALRNQMLDSLGFAGEPFSLQGLIAAADRAEAELLSGSEMSKKWKQELEALVAQAAPYRAALQESTTATELEISYMRENAKRTIEEALLSDKRIRIDGKKVTTESASLAAEEILLDIDRQLAEAKQKGLAKEQLIQEAQDRYIAAMIESSTGQFAMGPSVGAGPKATRDASRNMLRSNKPYAVERPTDFDMPYTGQNAVQVVEFKAKELAKQLSISVGEAVDLIFNSMYAQINIGLDRNSPSGEFRDLGRDVSAGVNMASDDATRSGEQIGQRIAVSAAQAGSSQSAIYRLSPTRVTTDANAYAAVAGPRLFGPTNNASDLLKEYFSAPSQSLDDLQEATTSTSSGFRNMNSVLMNTSFAFSSIAGITSMFGGELSAVNEALFNLSNIIFALSGVMLLVNGLEEVRAKILAKANVQSLGQLFSDMPLLFGKIKGGFTKILPGLLKFVRFAGPAAAAFGAFQIFGEIQKQQQAKIEGLGNAAFAAGKKLEQIGDILNIEFRNPNRSSQFSTPGGLGAGGGERVASVRESESFQTAITTDNEDGGFKQDLERLKSATLGEAEFALNTLALELMALAPEGTDPEAIKEFVAALAAEAGKEQVEINVNLDLNSKETFDNLAKEAAASAEIMQIAYGNTLDSLNQGPSGTFLQSLIGDETIIAFASQELLTSLNNMSAQYASFFVALEQGFLNGTLTADEYEAQVSSLISQIASLGNAGTIVIQNMFKDFGVEEELKGVEDVNNQLILLEALMSGVDFTEAGIDLKAIDKMDDFGASTEDVAKGTAELEKVQQASGKAIKKTAEELKKAEYDARANEIKVATDAIDEQIKANEDIIRLYPGLVEQLGSEEEALRAVNDEKTRELLLEAEKQDLIDGGTANRDKVIASLNQLADSEENVNNIRGQADMATYLKDLREQNSTLSWLTQNGMSTAQALQVIGNSTLYAGAAAAKASGDYEGFLADMKEILSLQSTLSGGGGGQKSAFQEAIDSLKEQRTSANEMISAYNKLRNAGLSVGQAFAAAKDPVIAAAAAATNVKTDKWKQLVNLINQTEAALRNSKLVDILAERGANNALLNSFTKITPLLSKMGLGLDDINEILGDPTLAQAFIDDLKDGEINSRRILNIINQIPVSKRIKIAFDMSTPEGMMGAFDEAYGRQMESFDLQEREINRSYAAREKAAKAAVDNAQSDLERVQNKIDGLQSSADAKQREIELDINRPIEKLNESIEGIERQIEFVYNRPIANLQDESSDLSRELELMDREAEKVNERFDAQAASLQKINEINAETVEQDKARQEIASALASGNAAEAAKAIRQARVEEQRRAREKAAKAIEAARELALANIRSSSGQTREQIEGRLLEINDAIYDLEQKREEKQKQIQLIQDQIYSIEEKRKPLLEQIRVIEDQIYEVSEKELKNAENAVKTAQDNADAIEDQRQAALDGIDAQRLEWDMLKDEATKAMLKSNGYLTSLEKARDMVNQIKKAWENVGSVAPNSIADITGGAGASGTGGATTGSGQNAKPPKPTADAGFGKTWIYDSKLKKWVTQDVPRPPVNPGTGNFWKWDTSKDSWTASKIPPKPPYSPSPGKTWSFDSAAAKWIEIALATGSSSGSGGGRVVPYATGGKVRGPGTGTSDSIPALLSNGEYVVKASSVRNLGVDFLDFLNRTGQVPAFARGGSVNKKDKPGTNKSTWTYYDPKSGTTSKSSVNTTKAVKPKPVPKIDLKAALAADNRFTSAIIDYSKGYQKAQITASIKNAIAADNKNTSRVLTRDALYKGGGFQGFEAGFQGTMEDISKIPLVKWIGEQYSADNLLGQGIRAIVGTLSVPVEMMGSIANTMVDSYDKVAKGDFLGAYVNSISVLPKSVIEGVSTAYSGVANVSNQKATMFEQAAQSAIDKNFFGAKNNPEMAALARIIGGSLNLVGDPLTYVGAGFATKALKAPAASAKFSLKNLVSDTSAVFKDLTPTAIANRAAVRAEQNALATQTQSVIFAARNELKNTGKLSGAYDWNAMGALANKLSDLDKRSLGAKIEMPENYQIRNISEVSPENLLDIARKLVNDQYYNVNRLGSVLNDGTSDIFRITTGNQRRAVAFRNPILDFLYSRGVLPTTPALSRLRAQMSNYSDPLNRSGLPQIGPYPSVLLNRFDSAFVTNQAMRDPLTIFPSKFDKLFGGNPLLGPISTTIGSRTLRRNNSVVGHEYTHIRDKANEIFPVLNDYPNIGSGNASREAHAVYSDAREAGKPVRPYNWFALDEAIIKSMAESPKSISAFYRTYLKADAPRKHQMGADWYKEYAEQISRWDNERALPYPIHDTKWMSAYNKTIELFDRNKLDSFTEPSKKTKALLESLRALSDEAGNPSYLEKAIATWQKTIKKETNIQHLKKSLADPVGTIRDIFDRKIYRRKIAQGWQPEAFGLESSQAITLRSIKDQLMLDDMGKSFDLGSPDLPSAQGSLANRAAELYAQLVKARELREKGISYRLAEDTEIWPPTPDPPLTKTLIAEMDGREVGSLELYPFDRSAAGREIKMIHVLQGYQKRGIASALFNEARLMGLKPLHSQVLSQQGKGFMQSVGGRQVGVEITERLKASVIDQLTSKYNMQLSGRERAMVIAQLRKNPDPNIDISTPEARRRVNIADKATREKFGLPPLDDIFNEMPPRWNMQMLNRMGFGTRPSDNIVESPQAASGGLISGGKLIKPKYFNVGGLARGTDIVPAMLTPGEFVVSRPAVQSYGIDNLKAINSGTAPAGSVYNSYEVNVNVKSDANPEQIARAVMTQIKQIDSQRIRSNRI